MCAKNILEADYNGSTLIQLGNFTLLFSVIAAGPLCVLPAKDTVEELFYKAKGMNTKQNLLVSFLVVSTAVIPALLVSGVGQAMALVGASINPVIGFILPVVFYWKTVEKLPIMSTEK